MIAVVQRVTRAQVRIAGREPEAIESGLLILLGVARDDHEADAEWLAKKCLTLRIFNDDDNRMNRALEDVGGGILIISQFTLLGDCIKGRRPSWAKAGEPKRAEQLYECFVNWMRRSPFRIATGVFQAKMEVESVNDGPVTLIIDSHAWKGRPATVPSGVSANEKETLSSTGHDVGHGTSLLRKGNEPLYLASRSPRRRQLLEMLGVRFQAVEPHEDGCERRPLEDPADYAMRQAEAKALPVARSVSNGIVLGADTVVYLDGEVLEKPAGTSQAEVYLRRLSGRTHEVFTGICLARAPGEMRLCAVERSKVTMSDLDEKTIRDYIATGEPMDKAGAYGIQGFGGLLVPAIEGCYFNVMGLPLARLRKLFGELERLAE